MAKPKRRSRATVPVDMQHTLDALERHTDALNRFRAALCGPDAADGLQQAERVAALVDFYITKERRRAKVRV